MRRSRGYRVLLGSVFVAALVVLLAIVIGWSRSLSKIQVEAALMELPKNAALRASTVQRRQLTLRIAGNDVAAEVAWVHVPRRTPASAPRRPVVLVHGTPGSLFTWSEVVTGRNGSGGLAADFDVYLLDVVGHGITDAAVAEPLTFQACADWVGGAIAALGLGPVHLVGNSYGGEFCWRAALDRPDLVRTLTLIDSSGWQRPDDGWLPEEVAMRELSLARLGWLLTTRDKIRGALQPHFPFPVGADQVDECFVLCRNPANWRGMVDLARDENGGRQDEISRIAVPLLLLWGADDIAYPVERDARRWQSAVPAATLRVLPGCGHYPQETVPDEVATLIREFATGHDK